MQWDIPRGVHGMVQAATKSLPTGGPCGPRENSRLSLCRLEHVAAVARAPLEARGLSPGPILPTAGIQANRD